jgi:hypothetical protein
MLFRGPYIGNKSWKQTLLQFIQEIRNQVEMYRPTLQAGGDVAAGRLVAINGNRTVGLSDVDGPLTHFDGVTEEAIVDTYRGRVRYSGLVRCKLVTGLGAPVPPGTDIYTSSTAGEGSPVGAPGSTLVGRVFEDNYLSDETVILRITCCTTIR